ncbi:MAG: DUF1996 domain-containing protein [Nitrososphaerales archaeon]
MDCAAGQFLTFEASFQSCWDGTRLDSADHRSHVAHSSYNNTTGERSCPSTHPVRLPGMSVFGLWVPDGLQAKSIGYHLSSDGAGQQGQTMHADFWNTWQQSELERITQVCLVEHGDIPESPDMTINGTVHDPSCLQADSQYATTSPSPSPSPTVSPTPTISPSPTVSAFCVRHPNHRKCQ